jgi:hypothetical protein
MMSRFLTWNDLLLAEFFSPASASEEVWLHTTRGELDAFGIHLGGAEGLVEAVASGAPWLHAGLATCADQARVLVQQRVDRLAASANYQDPGTTNPIYVAARAPVYLPILALWVLAASDIQQEGGFYAAVSKTLKRPFPNSPQVTAAMLLAWEDLELWSRRYCAGKFGVFRTRMLGEHRFVGIPRSQCLVNHSDARNFARLFLELGLRPGQQLADATFQNILERGKEANFLSRALKSAMSKVEYADPLRSLVTRLLCAWDGQRPLGGVPDSSAVAGRGGDPDIDRLSVDALALVLSPSDEIVDGWDVRWQFPAMADMSRCSVELQGTALRASLEQGSASFLTKRGHGDCRVSSEALSSSATASIDVKVSFDEDEDGGSNDGYRQLQIVAATRRILCWNTSDPRFGAYLAERDIPLYGPVYLVCSNADKANTEQWLRGEGIDFLTVPATGLPSGWWMACILRAEALSAEQRHQIEESPASTEVPAARIRLVGGRPLMRGGARLFASYDLPSIYIEAKPGALLEAPGLQLHEIMSTDPSGRLPSARRFVIDDFDSKRSVFDLKVVRDDTELAAIRLRVAGIDGEGLGATRTFSMSRLGLSHRDGDGLRGHIVGGIAGDIAWPDAVKVPIDDFSNDTVCDPQDTAAGQFLDSVARLGSVDFGSARDQIRRLTEQIEPIPLLMDLRARGCVDIETDSKGHVVRVHRVAPTLYELPAQYEGLPVFGVGGSLRLRHWSLLRANPDFLTSLRNGDGGSLPVLRIAAMGMDAVKGACTAMDFQLACRPAEIIAEWSGSVQEAKEAFARSGMEQFFAELSNLHRLKPDSARFVPTESRQASIDPLLGAQLFRFDDPQASTMQLYLLGCRVEAGSRYSHVQDSRWGVWISQLAFAQMLRDRHGMNDAFPWPLEYDPIKGDVWIPARLRPPAVLERSLASCSGTGPELFQLSNGARVNGRLPIIDDRSGRIVGSASPVYEGFLPGYWLRYGCVPFDLAAMIAARLGGTIDPIVGRVHRANSEALVA